MLERQGKSTQKGGDGMEKRREYDLDEIVGCPKCDSIDLDDDGTAQGTKCNDCGCVFSVRHVAIWEEPD